MGEQREKDLFLYFSRTSKGFADRYNASEQFKERYQVWNSLLEKYSAHKKTALDMGCGSGIFSFLLAKEGLKVIGIDAADKMIELCEVQRQKFGINNPKFLKADFAHLDDLKLQRVDILICSSVLEYIDDLEATLEKFCNLLNDDGLLIVSLPNASCLYRKFEKYFFKLFDKPEYYKYVINFASLNYLSEVLSVHGMSLLENHYYAQNSLISGFCKFFRFSPKFIGNLFVAVYQKRR